MPRKKILSGRPKFLKAGKTTGISMEGALLERVQKVAFKKRMSVSAWLSQAAEEKLEHQKATEAQETIK